MIRLLFRNLAGESDWFTLVSLSSRKPTITEINARFCSIIWISFVPSFTQAPFVSILLIDASPHVSSFGPLNISVLSSTVSVNRKSRRTLRQYHFHERGGVSQWKQQWECEASCYPIGNGPEVEKKIWSNDVLPNIIYYSSVLKTAASRILPCWNY
jgi:hypothetical protein